MFQPEMGEPNMCQPLGLHFPRDNIPHVEAMSLPNGIMPHVCHQSWDLQKDITEGGLVCVEVTANGLDQSLPLSYLRESHVLPHGTLQYQSNLRVYPR